MPDRTPQSPTDRLATNIEVSTVITPHNPIVPAPSPDDDPTGVRDLLSSLPQPDPMPGYLVERINASLAAEQAQRAATPSGASVTPLLARTRRRPGRLLFAIAGAAAAVALVAVVGDNVFKANQASTISGSAAAPITSSARSAGGAAPQGLQDKSSGAPAPAAAPTIVQIRLSETRYTRADFVTQARALLALDQIRPLATKSAESAAAGPLGTTPGLTDCLSAIGAGGAQVVRADLAVYEGRPAVIIVATTNGIRSAYAVGRQCSQADAAVLRPATPLP
jgi:hypothetical protein